VKARHPARLRRTGRKIITVSRPTDIIDKVTRILNLVRQDCNRPGTSPDRFLPFFAFSRWFIPPFVDKWTCVSVYRCVHAVIIVGDGECGWPDGFYHTGRTAVDTVEEKSRLEAPPRGRFLRRTRENAVIWAHSANALLGSRRKNDNDPPNRQTRLR
jgi:hypothetical protein